MHRKALGCAALKIPELAEGFSCPARARARRDGGGHPWLSLWESCRRQPTERAPLKKGVIKGGGIASPFGIKLYKTVPLPRLRGKIYLHGMDAGGGVSERRWRSAANRSQLPLRSALNGRHRRPAPEPAGETGVGSTQVRSPHPKSRSALQRRDFPAPRGHAPGRRGGTLRRGGKQDKKRRSIVYSPPGWYDNAPTLLRRGCAAL